MRTLLLIAALSATARAQQTETPPPAVSPAPQTPAPQTPAPQMSAPQSPGTPQQPTPDTSAMSPSEAYLYAMQPFNNARSAPDDLTDADKWALHIGIARANEQCEVLKIQKFQDEDLLALGKLCIFGQDFEPARHVLVDYLALPKTKSPEVGRLLLVRAFLGLRSIPDAWEQIDILLTAFPYDASIHLAIDMTIDAAEASDYTDDLDVIGRLNEQQLPHTLDALTHGASLTGNGDSVDAAMLVRDALRCADALRRTQHADEAEKILTQVRTIVAAGPIPSSASYPAIEDALTRYEMSQKPSPVRKLEGGDLTAAGGNIPRIIPLYDTDPAAHRIVHGSGSHTDIRFLDDRTLVLVFSLAGPASSAAIQKILDRLAQDRQTPGLKVVAVTSFAANIGVDVPDPSLLPPLRAFRATLPAKLPVLIVPDTQLKPFAIDMWPAAILFDGKGRILWLNTISGSDGSIRQMVREMETPILPIEPAATAK
jgi:hypothetical protein